MLNKTLAELPCKIMFIIYNKNTEKSVKRHEQIDDKYIKYIKYSKESINNSKKTHF